MEIILVNVHRLILESIVNQVVFYFIIFFSSLFLITVLNSKGRMDSNDQTILANFYNSLTSKGTLNWNIANDLCGQPGIVCDYSNPKRVYQLYSSLYDQNLWINCCHIFEKNIDPFLLWDFQERFRQNLEIYQSYGSCKILSFTSFFWKFYSNTQKSPEQSLLRDNSNPTW